ncbi:MAG: OadG family protein [Bacteroidales bacterium]|jgi:Na+-transporting methylmalonyl-CoA/oxaloacetate decarboxylase gamma subunit|nr:OadG family protein [Bacteroidales bacterium]
MVLCEQISINFSNIDNPALIITVVGLVAVIIALAVLAFVIGRITNIQNFFVKIKLRKRETKSDPTEEKPLISISADENAAICTALYLYFTEMHDEEKYVMTVKKVSRNYSPWSSKIYGVMSLSKRR